MTRRLILFIAVWLGALLWLPWIHLAEKGVSSPSNLETLDTLHRLFRNDELLSLTGFYLYKLGISQDPANVMAGKDGWLYLGNGHEAVLDTLREGSSDKNLLQLEQTMRCLNDWEKWLKQHNIRIAIILGPNKETIYPEYLPDWLTPAHTSVLDSLKNYKNLTILDLSSELLIRKKDKNPLYFRTDTHWTSLGAWSGYTALKKLSQQQDFHWLTAADFEAVPTFGPGGDLARFLRIEHLLEETYVDWRLREPYQSQYFDFDSGQTKENGEPQPGHPMQTLTPKALNPHKVLWLRDSFGNRMVPWIDTTFRNTVQWHWREAFSNPQRLQALIQRYQPDLVVLTVVERSLLAKEWQPLPSSNH